MSLDLTTDRQIQERPHDISKIIDESKFPQQFGNIVGASPEDGPQEVVPMVVNDSGPKGNELRLKVKVSAVDVDKADVAQREAEWESLMVKGKNPQDFTLEADFTSLLRPFSSALPKLTWPDTTEYSEHGGFSVPATSVLPELIGRPTYSSTSDTIIDVAPDFIGSLPQFVVEPRGLVGPDGQENPDPAFGTSNTAGATESYRKPVATEGAGFSSNIPAPIGTFDAQDLPQDLGEANYVPFGAYDSANAKMITSTGVSTSVSPNLSGLDFMTGPPGAITDLQGGASLRGEAPIDAVRVRVSNISEYSEESRYQNYIREIRRSRMGFMDQAASMVQGLSALENVLLPILPEGRRAVKNGLDARKIFWTSLASKIEKIIVRSSCREANDSE